MDAISVIIPYYKGGDTILECLKALDKQENAPVFEVIIVDDSGKREISKIEFLPENYRLRFIFQKHQGQSAATNNGIKKARGKIVLLFAQDMIASGALLAEHNAAHERMHDPGAAVLGYMPFHPDIPHTDFHDFLLSGAQFDFTGIEGNTLIDPSRYFYAPNISLHKDFLLDNGLFDEELTYGYQDLELGYRLKAHGLKLYFNKRALAYHRHPITLNSFCKKQTLMGTQARILYKKYPQFESKEHRAFLNEIKDRKEIIVFTKRFLGAADSKEKGKAVKQAAPAMSRLKSEPAQKIASLLMRCAGKPGLAVHLVPLFYRLILSYYFSQGYFAGHGADQAESDGKVKKRRENAEKRVLGK
jgi:GT2 family glycosyltransferase